MRSKKIKVSHFSNAIEQIALCLRPDNEAEIADCPENSLARGAGLSYSDCCFNPSGYLIDTQRLNHFIKWDPDEGIVECQPAIRFKDLLYLDPHYIPPILPGSLHVTLGGGIANDVHGKNNHIAGSLGEHILWLELYNGSIKLRCSREQHADLFHASIAGLGLTGTITRIALKMQKAAKYVQVDRQQFTSHEQLLNAMSGPGLHYDYQVAWLDLLNSQPVSILSNAKTSELGVQQQAHKHSIPKLPFSLIRPWNMRLYNKLYTLHKTNSLILSLEQFNNPLDSIKHWNRLYGPKGLLQFQAVFSNDLALDHLERIKAIINKHQATPTLAVLKLFKQPGIGLLSFCQPGFSLAIDFIANNQAKTAIHALNQYLCDIQGKVYLAKDLLLTAAQCQIMYEKLPQFQQVLQRYDCQQHSALAQRLGIKL